MRMTQVTWPPSGRDGTVLFRRLRHRRLHHRHLRHRRLRHRRLTNRSGTAGLSRLNPPVVADSLDSISFRARRQKILLRTAPTSLQTMSRTDLKMKPCEHMDLF